MEAKPSSPTSSAGRAQILIIDDEPEHADVMAESLRKPGHVCTIVSSVAEALEELRHGAFDVIVTDLRMPNSAGVAGTAADGSDAGLKVLEFARRLQPNAETIMVTAHGDVPTARAAFKVGAYDFIEKPLDLEVFRSLVNRAADTVLLRHEAGNSMTDLVQNQGFEGIIAGSEPMRRILRLVKTVAASQLPVLITGESGTGKELIAHAIHKNSPRGALGKRFVALNCAAEAENLLEDQLFGHVRGAFTGAEKDREGVFEYANGGTLFLDEIGDMPLKMQAKLLRVLETGEVVRLGSNEPRKTDVRLVSATNKDLKAMSGKPGASNADAGAAMTNTGGGGLFREDLYFRIAGSVIALPALRERREDIPRIVRHAIAKFATTVGGVGGVGGSHLRAEPASGSPPSHAIPAITDAAMMRLTSYNWPGNVRQLLNVVQNMVVTAIGEATMGDAPHAPVPHAGRSQPVTLDVRHIPDDIRVSDDHDDQSLPHHDADAMGAGITGSTNNVAGSLAGTSLAQLEKRAIRETLRLTAGNREHAAKLLGIGERTLYRKLKEYGLR